VKLLSATPSPYARKVRIVLAEKELPFELVTEVPWNQDASAPRWNPLGKIPVLILARSRVSSAQKRCTPTVTCSVWAISRSARCWVTSTYASRTSTGVPRIRISFDYSRA
jgi:hypothetical protein